jgi:putative Mn2+ efflux pump MntP
MEFFTLVFVALGLSADAFAISVSNGMCYRNIDKKQEFFTALTFGLFQAVMPMLGYLAGRSFSRAISFLDHWIALGLLGYIGGKMVYGAVKELRHPESCPPKKEFTFQVLMLQGVASSIDAFAVGISFAVMGLNIFLSAALIGGITFVCCLFGAQLGRRFGMLLKQKAEIIGGLILIGIGIKVFLEHILS